MVKKVAIAAIRNKLHKASMLIFTTPKKFIISNCG